MERIKLVFGCAILALSFGLSPAYVGAQAEETTQATATSPPAAAPVASPSPRVCIGSAATSAVQQIKEALRSPLKSTGLEFTEQPLDQVLSKLQEEYGIPIVLDLPALQDAGVSPQGPVTISLHKISLRSALRLMLRQHQLTYIILDEVLMITTPEQADSHLVTCVYDVHDLTNGGTDSQAFQMLIEAIKSCVAPDYWALDAKTAGGGQGEIRPIKQGLLVILQTQSVHEEVVDLLEKIRPAQSGRGQVDADATTEGRNNNLGNERGGEYGHGRGEGLIFDRRQ